MSMNNMSSIEKAMSNSMSKVVPAPASYGIASSYLDDARAYCVHMISKQPSAISSEQRTHYKAELAGIQKLQATMLVLQA